MQSELLARTQLLVSERKERLSVISRKSGVPYFWLYALSRNDYSDYNVVYVERLYVYLSGKSLNLS